MEQSQQHGPLHLESADHARAGSDRPTTRRRPIFDRGKPAAGARTAACAEGTGRAQGISGGAEEAPKQEEMRSDHSLGDLTARDRFRSDPATRFFKYCAAIPWGSSFMQCGNTTP